MFLCAVKLLVYGDFHQLWEEVCDAISGQDLTSQLSPAFTFYLTADAPAWILVPKCTMRYFSSCGTCPARISETHSRNVEPSLGGTLTPVWGVWHHLSSVSTGDVQADAGKVAHVSSYGQFDADQDQNHVWKIHCFLVFFEKNSDFWISAETFKFWLSVSSEEETFLLTIFFLLNCDIFVSFFFFWSGKNLFLWS